MALLKKLYIKNRSNLYKLNQKIIDTDPEKMYSSMYYITDINYLNTYIANNSDQNKKNELLDLFEVNTIINKCDKPNCISVSFFCQNVCNTYVNQYGTINYNDVNLKWYKKYYVNIIKFIKNFNISIYSKTYKIRIYLEKQLEILIPKLITTNVEIYLMKNNSIGAAPGVFWRYLVLDDKDIDIAHIFDIDEPFNNLSHYIKLFSTTDKILGRCFLPPAKDFRIKKKNAINYPTVLGGIIGIRPKKVDINFLDTCVNYILYKMFRLTTAHPNLENDNDQETIYNIPIENHIFGWGNHWCRYGFDERMWKHLFFPYFIKKGEVFSYTNNKLSDITSLIDAHPIKIDYNFCKYYNNTFSNNI
jgi:hypothetical protein